MKFYLYRHIRPDKNEPFYIGKGKKSERNWRKITTEYARAYSIENRNKHWRHIYELCNKNIEVEILYESDDHEVIKAKEIEFISLYGREDLGKGTLVNFTDGGDGQLGRIKTPEEIERTASKHRGKKLSPEHRSKISIASKGENNGFYGRKHTLETRAKMSASDKLIVRTPEQLRKIKDAQSLYFQNHPEFGQWRRKPVIQLTIGGQFVAEHPSLKAAAEAVGSKYAESLGAVCQGRIKVSHGYKWKFKE